MKWIFLILMLSSFLFADEIIVSISDFDKELSSWIAQNRIEVVYKDASQIDLILDEEKCALLKEMNYEYSIISTDESRLRDLDGYRSYEVTTLELFQLASNYPDIIELSSLGNSTCYDYYLAGNENYEEFQHEIWCIKLSDNVDEEEDEPNIFFASEIHAREPISLEVNMNILNYLVSNYGIIDSVTNWIDNTQIWFVPLMNPDGHKLVIDGTHTMHRKNMRDNNGNNMPDFSTTDGVDLNRNFGYIWGDNGTSNSYTSNIYHGPNAWSEQEDVYLKELLQSHKFYAGITYHSYGQWVLYPLGHLPGVCSYDHEIMDDLAVEMATTITRQNGIGNYTPQQAVDFGYTCQGTMGDWGYAEERIFAFTLELASSYIPPQSAIEQICDENLEAALMMLDRINSSTISGIIYSDQNNPIVADIIVHEIDDIAGMSAVENVKSGETFGRYYRMLLPGDYTITFQKDGYIPRTFENVEVTNEGVTELNVVLSTSEFLANENIIISKRADFIFLEWDNEAGFDYEIYSSTNPNNNFILENNGEFVSENIWKEMIFDDKKFYKIKKNVQ